MLLRWTTVLCACTALAACTTPYRPPVFVHGGAAFQGIAGLIDPHGTKQVDVLLVHGMCTHTRDDAKQAIDRLAAALDKNLLPELAKAAVPMADEEGIQIETRTIRIGKGAVRFTALVWSPLTESLKQQLAYDETGQASDCAAPGECKPKRALVNGRLKDGLLNDCLADALIYQGETRIAIRQKMASAIARVVDDSNAEALRAGLSPGSFALVTHSLGSKIGFDALETMRSAQAPANQRAAEQSALNRLAIIFMQANQMPILGLAEQTIEKRPGPSAEPPARQDSLLRLLKRKLDSRGTGAPRPADASFRLALVAFTDPNDLLSYRLLPSRYAIQGIDVADVLVSNASTFFGALEWPTTAHTGYASNEDVARMIACGSTGSLLCK